MGLNNIFWRRSDVAESQNGNAPIAEGKADLAERFLDHILGAWDVLTEARQAGKPAQVQPNLTRTKNN